MVGSSKGSILGIDCENHVEMRKGPTDASPTNVDARPNPAFSINPNLAGFSGSYLNPAGIGRKPKSFVMAGAMAASKVGYEWCDADSECCSVPFILCRAELSHRCRIATRVDQVKRGIAQQRYTRHFGNRRADDVPGSEVRHAFGLPIGNVAGELAKLSAAVQEPR